MSIDIRMLFRRLIWSSAMVSALVFVFCLSPSTGRPAFRSTPKTIVSIQFDDGTMDQTLPAKLLAAHGMHATFFVISSRLGTIGYMSLAQVRALQQAGNEIGGHTLHHLALPTLSAARQDQEICLDRRALLEDGLHVRFFAYPFGRADLTSGWYAAACGYNAARGEDGIQCTRCDTAETIPPLDRYYVRAPYAANEKTTLADLQEEVTTAELGGGGWLNLIFHRVCSGCNGGHDVVPPAVFDAFLTWLASRTVQGTVVSTYRDVIGGPLQPPVVSPAAPPAVLKQPDLSVDGSFEDVAQPCWQALAATGTPLFVPTNDAHTGSRAETVVVSANTNTSIVPTRDGDGACAIPAAARERFSVAAWHKGAIPAAFVAYYVSATGNWLFWTSSSSILFAAADWQRAIWTTPPTPDGARAVAIGFQVRGTAAGRATVDDLSVSQLDAAPPRVALGQPSLAATNIVLRATAVSSHAPIERVSFTVDGTIVGVARRFPFQFRYEFTNHERRRIAVSATAVDINGLTAISKEREFVLAR